MGGIQQNEESTKKGLFARALGEDLFARLDIAPHVLIVDDDVDAALAMEKVFREFGCDTTIAANASEAQKLMLSRKADLVILDWLLDKDDSGDKVLSRVSQKLHRFFSQPFAEDEKTVVITHSCLSEREINMPESAFYSHFAHWQKPMIRPLLIKKISTLLSNLPS